MWFGRDRNNRLVGSVTPCWDAFPWTWRARCRGRALPGEWASVEETKAAVEAQASTGDRPQGPGRRRPDGDER